MGIPFIDLKAQYKRIKEDVDRRVMAVLEHGMYIMGPEVRELESKLTEFTGAKHAISCSSGTDALLMPLMAWGVGPGDAVFTTPFTFVATAEVIALLGATPVFVDIDPDTFNIDPVKIAEAVKKVKQEGKLTPRGIIPVDLFGLPADYDPIMELAEAEGLWVLEDTAQGLGGVYKGRIAGNLGHVAATSFFPAKPLGAYGDAGAVFTNDDELAERMDSIRIHGKGTNKYDNVRIGLNARMDAIQAAVMISKLGIFPDEMDARDRVAARYSEALGDAVKTPKVPQGYRSVWAQYSVLSDKREAIQAALKAEDIPTAVYYPIPLHLQTGYKYLGYQKGDMPICEAIADQVFSLPMHPYLEDATIDHIASVIQSC